MAKALKAFKVVRNNWKKSAFGLAVLSYSAHLGKNKYDNFELMRGYCEEAFKYGNAPLPANNRCRQVTVILNPAASRRKAKKNFEKYCAPLLHLAGIIVNIVQTEYEGQARKLVETLETSADAVVVAGGDGTLSEVITGLLRRPEGDVVLPLGVLPLGRTNTVASLLFGSDDTVKMMAEATMSVIREVMKPVDVMRVQVIQEMEGESKPPVYCVAGMEWGAYRDVLSKRDKYWYWGALRLYAGFVFMGLKDSLTWQCKAHLRYILPCNGCSKCYTVPLAGQTRWWHVFVPKQNTVKEDYSKVLNEECGLEFEEEISTVDFQVTVGKTENIQISVGPKTIGYLDFVLEGWRRLRNKEPQKEKTLSVRELILKPLEISPKWISIDSEEYELKMLQMVLLKNKVNLFCSTGQ